MVLIYQQLILNVGLLPFYMGNQRKAQAKAITLSKLRFNLLFILASGPHVESTQGNLKFTAPLDRYYYYYGRGDSESGGILRLACTVAARF